MFNFEEFLKEQVAMMEITREFNQCSDRLTACRLLGMLMEQHKDSHSRELIIKAFYNSAWKAITEEQVYKVVNSNVNVGVFSRPAKDIYAACQNGYEFNIMAGMLFVRYAGDTKKQEKVFKALDEVMEMVS